MYDEIERTPALREALDEYEKHNYDAALTLCREVMRSGDNPFGLEGFQAAPDRDSELTGRTGRAALLLTSRCCAAVGDIDGAIFEHGKALCMASDTYDVIRMADDAAEAGLPADYCAGCYERASREFKDIGDVVGAANALNKAGICYFKNGNSLAGEAKMFEQAVALLKNEELSDSQLILYALVCGNLAECRVRQGRHDEAHELYRTASDIFESRLDDDTCLQHYAMCQRSIADICRGRGDNVEASAHLGAAIDALRRRKLPSPILRNLLSSSYNAYGTICFQMGDYDGEVNACTSALRLRSEPERDALGASTIYANRAQANEQLGRLRQAEDDYRSSIELLERLDSNEASVLIALRRYSLAGISEINGDYTEAVNLYSLSAAALRTARLSGVEFDDISSEQITDMEALCRYRLGVCCTHCDHRDYYRSMNEYRASAELLHSLDLTPDRSSRLAAVFNAIGELYEIFDDYESANASFEAADRFNSINNLTKMIFDAVIGSDGTVCDDGSHLSESAETISDSDPAESSELQGEEDADSTDDDEDAESRWPADETPVG